MDASTLTTTSGTTTSAPEPGLPVVVIGDGPVGLVAAAIIVALAIMNGVEPILVNMPEPG